MNDLVVDDYRRALARLFEPIDTFLLSAFHLEDMSNGVRRYTVDCVKLDWSSPN